MNETSRAYTGPLPLRIVTFWNDQATHVLNYEMTAETSDFLSLPLMIQAPERSGSYQFNVVVFTLPGYSQFDAKGQERTAFPQGIFSRRVLVDVAP
jgi:hypothetical protein